MVDDIESWLVKGVSERERERKLFISETANLYDTVAAMPPPPLLSLKLSSNTLLRAHPRDFRCCKHFRLRMECEKKRRGKATLKAKKKKLQKVNPQ
uniref:Uncharacterized protein n=1 Tax=Trichogramma kaykai TaxID=54128 RepID=A0ABD2W2U9_9HYME